MEKALILRKYKGRLLPDALVAALRESNRRDLAYQKRYTARTQ